MQKSTQNKLIVIFTLLGAIAIGLIGYIYIRNISNISDVQQIINITKIYLLTALVILVIATFISIKIINKVVNKSKMDVATLEMSEHLKDLDKQKKQFYNV